MAPIPPTEAEKQAKKKAKAERKNQAEAERIENQSQKNGNHVVMNSDGSYSSLGALTPETPYATSHEDNATASPSTNALNQVSRSASAYTFGSNTGGRPFSSQGFGKVLCNQVPSANGIFNFNISPAAPKPNFDFAARPSSDSSSSQPPSSRIFSSVPSTPNLASTFGPNPGHSLQQAPTTNPFNPVASSTFKPPSTDNFSPVPTSTSGLDPTISPKAPHMLFPPPSQDVNAPAKNLNLMEILKTLNATGPNATSTQQSDSLSKPFDLGMQMRQSHDNPDELDKCIAMMEIRDAGKDAGIKRLEDELSFLQQKVKDARYMEQEIANLQLDNSNLEIKANDLKLALAAEVSKGEAKDRRIAELDHNNEAVKASAQSVHAQQAEQLIVKEAEIAELKARNSDAETTNTGITERAEEYVRVRDRRITELEHDNEAIKVRAQTMHDQQMVQVTARDEEIATLKAAVDDLVTTNKGITEKAEADMEAKERWIAELRRNRQDADDRYKALVALHEQESLKFKNESEDKEAAVEEYREAAHVKSKQFENLKQQVKDANLKAKKSEDHARSSDNRVEQQVKAIADNKTTISGLHATIQHLKKELQEYEEEMKNMRNGKGSASESHSDCNAQIQRLKSDKTEKEHEIEKLKGSYTVQHAEEINHAEQQYMLAQEAEIGLRHDIDMVRLRVQEHEQTIGKLRQENRQLRDEVEEFRKMAKTEPGTAEKAAAKADAEDGNLLSSPRRGNELSEFSPCLPVPETPEPSPEPSASHPWPPGQWRPQTESMMGDSDGSDSSEDGGERTVTLSISDPVTLVNFQPSDGSPGHNFATSKPVEHGLGIMDVSVEMCDQGTQTNTPLSPPKLGLSQLRTILDFKPNSPALSINGPVTVLESTPTLPPKLGNSEPTTIVNQVPLLPTKLEISKPVTVIDHTPSSHPELGMSILRTVVNFKPNSPEFNTSKPPTTVDQSSLLPPKLSFSKLWTVVDLKPNMPKLSTSEPVTIVDNMPSSQPRLGISKIRTIINTKPDIPKASVSKPLTIMDNSPSSAVVPPTHDKQPKEEKPSKWQRLWYLLLLLMLGVLTFATFYGESARRERNMWLEANDFTRRAVISVRAGGGTGTSFPAWLWKDQLLDMTRYYYN
ncbi:MAG: hypothetical protein Q9209_005812 [Squamulea sp. 1 TL-2023]